MGIFFMIFAIAFGAFGWMQFKKNKENDKDVFLNGQKVTGAGADKVRGYGMLMYYGVTGLFFVVGACMTFFPMLHIYIDPFWIFPGVFLLVGLVFVAVAVIIRRVNKKVSSEGMTALGTIESVERESSVDIDHDYHIRYVPVVRYYFQGKEYYGKAMMGSGSLKRYKIGERVEIQVNPEMPELFHLEKDNETVKVIYGIFLAVGILCAVIGIVAAMLLILL